MPHFACYDLSSGRLLQVMEIPADECGHYLRPDVGVVECAQAANLSLDYIQDGTVTTRPTLPGFDKTAIQADSTDIATLVGLPDPCSVTVNGQTHMVTGGTLELDADYPGLYAVEISHFPYRDFTQEITAS